MNSYYFTILEKNGIFVVVKNSNNLAVASFDKKESAKMFVKAQNWAMNKRVVK